MNATWFDMGFFITMMFFLLGFLVMIGGASGEKDLFVIGILFFSLIPFIWMVSMLANSNSDQLQSYQTSWMIGISLVSVIAIAVASAMFYNPQRQRHIQRSNSTPKE